MHIRSLGKTTRPVSALGLGLAALGRPGYINLGHANDLEQQYDPEAMKRRAHAVLDRAWELGIRYFDAARSYGRGEEFLAAWLRSRALPEGTFTVGSKWGYTYTADWQIQATHHEVKDHSLPVLRRQFRESRELLGKHLHVYQIHSATLASKVLERPEVLRELHQLKQEQVAVGLSVSGPEQGETVARALEVSIDGVPLFDVVQATWNLLEPSVGLRLAEAHAQGVGVIVKEALANGRLTGRNNDRAFAPRRARLDAVANRLGCPLDALALAVALHQPWADVVLSGATTIEQLNSNVRATTIPWDQDLGSTLTSLAESPQTYWQTRAELAWN